MYFEVRCCLQYPGSQNDNNLSSKNSWYIVLFWGLRPKVSSCCRSVEGVECNISAFSRQRARAVSIIQAVKIYSTRHCRCLDHCNPAICYMLPFTFRTVCRGELQLDVSFPPWATESSLDISTQVALCTLDYRGDITVLEIHTHSPMFVVNVHVALFMHYSRLQCVCV